MEKKQFKFNEPSELNQDNSKSMVQDAEKKSYLAPSVSVIHIEMEQGIAAGSATVTPGVVNGNTDNVSTDWGGSDTTTIDTPF
ncbi:hypothetical protein ACH34C_09710 [Elizabethkingia anophelis]|uniref:hypothetical protein n=1 Tax=Elizabethkingia anophelis TaxID=1117645 RepID=UPI0037870415